MPGDITRARYGPICINFGAENRQAVLRLQASNRKICSKKWAPAFNIYFHCNHLQSKKLICVKRIVF